MNPLKSILSRMMLAAVVVAAMASCSANKTNLTYFNDIAGIEAGEIALNVSSYQLRPEDELRVTVSSVDPAATAAYNAPIYSPSNGNAVSPTPMMDTYIIDSEGNINLPVIGKVHAAGLTEEQLAQKVVGLISKDVVDPYVTVRLLSFKVRVLGEVDKPGDVYKPQYASTYTVLDAVASAGDMNEFSDRSNVMVLRKENGKMTYHRLNLNESKSIESPYFFLQQDDIVIVPPSKTRQSNAAYDNNNSYRMQVVSTIVSVVSVIASLVIALVVK